MNKDIHQKLFEFFRNINYFKDKEYCNKQNYLDEFINWTFESIQKNNIICFNKLNNIYVEEVDRPRSKVYWIDFGVNIGSEFNYPHFCVVIREFKYTALVVPISTEKEDDSEWKSTDNLIVKIGKINNLPYEKKDCYAMVNQIRAVSKKRLDNYKDEKGQYHKLSLSSTQMDLIEEQLIKLCKNYAFETTTYQSDYY